MTINLHNITVAAEYLSLLNRHNEVTTTADSKSNGSDPRREIAEALCEELKTNMKCPSSNGDQFNFRSEILTVIKALKAISETAASISLDSLREDLKILMLKFQDAFKQIDTDYIKVTA